MPLNLIIQFFQLFQKFLILSSRDEAVERLLSTAVSACPAFVSNTPSFADAETYVSFKSVSPFDNPLENSVENCPTAVLVSASTFPLSSIAFAPDSAVTVPDPAYLPHSP